MQAAPDQTWQIIATIVTTVGVLVALGIALWGGYDRRRERDALVLSEARTFRVRGTGIRDREPLDENDPYRCEFMWFVEHHGEHPVFDVYYEAWPSGADLHDVAWLRGHCEAARPGDSLDLVAGHTTTSGDFRLTAWRVRWRDRFGREWVVDTPNQATPAPFLGQPPRAV